MAWYLYGADHVIDISTTHAKQNYNQQNVHQKSFLWVPLITLTLFSGVHFSGLVPSYKRNARVPVTKAIHASEGKTACPIKRNIKKKRSHTDSNLAMRIQYTLNTISVKRIVHINQRLINITQNIISLSWWSLIWNEPYRWINDFD